jgi:predicted permease
MPAIEMRSLRVALRRLTRAPTFTFAAAVTLTLGLGAALAVFTLVDRVLLRPLPYRNADRLVDLSHTLAVSGVLQVDQSDATYLLYRRANRTHPDVGAYRATAVNVRGPSASNAERLPAALTTPSVFRVLGAAALAGRELVESDGEPGAPPVAVIAEGAWRRLYGAAPDVVGRRLTVDGVARTVVGIMPSAFTFPNATTELWLPLQLDPARTKSAAFDYRGIARLRDGVTIAAASADLQRLLPDVPRIFPGRLTAPAITATHMQAVARPLRDVVIGDASRVLWIVFGGVAALLLLACANVANLFLARAEGRQRELAVRRALGSGRGTLLLDFVIEAIVLAGAAAVLGVAFAAGALRLLQSSDAAASIPRLVEVHVDALTAAVAAVGALVVARAVSLLPALRASDARRTLTGLLGAHGASGPRGRHVARRALVIAQVALALVLVVAAGLFARSFAKLRDVNPGFEAEHALAFRLALPDVTYPTTITAAQTVVATLDAIRAVPGVAAAGVITKLPLDDEARQDSAVFVDGRALGPNEMPGIYSMAFASPGYFDAMSIPLIAGRLFAAPEPGRDPRLAPREVVVSDALAKAYWGVRAAVGRRIRMNPGDPWSTVVGVVGSVRGKGLDQPPEAAVYIPLVTTTSTGEPWTPRNVAFVVRGPGDPDALSAGVRSAVQSAAPGLPMYHTISLGELRAHAVSRTTLTLALLGAAAGLALVIGATGIYGVIAYLVSLRTREIGVRLALGAQPHDVRRLVLGRALTDAGIGVAIGVAGALVAGHAAAAALFGVTARDPITYALAAIVLLGTAVVASWVPARRAARMDPSAALRAE